MTEYEQNIEVMKDLRNRIDAVLASNNVTTLETEHKHPDPKKHKYYSFIKSGLRIGAGLALLMIPSYWITIAGGLIIFAEIFGIVEEMV